MSIVLQILKKAITEEKSSPDAEQTKMEIAPIKSEKEEFYHAKDGILKDEIKQNNESVDFKTSLETVDMRNGCDVDCSRLEELKTKDIETNSSKICIVEPPLKMKKPREKLIKVPKEKRVLKEDIPLSERLKMITTKKAKKRENESSNQSSAKRQKTTKDLVEKKPSAGRSKRSLDQEKYALLKVWYDDCLSEMSTCTNRSRSFQRQPDFQCCCISEVVSDNVVECPKCQTWQHAECVGYDKTSADYEYYCFRCWVDLPPLVSSGTVIISPEAISQQWVSEVRL